nr:MAG TPA: tail protein [Caudoviricetes sp.]
MSFSKKRIVTDISLASGQFSIGGGNTAALRGLRTSCIIEVNGGFSQSNMQMAIYGLPLSLMNQLSNVGKNLNKSLLNTITVQAGDDEMGMHLVFQGQIYSAFVDARAMPEVAFRIQAVPGGFDKVKPATPMSFKGSGNVSQMMSQIAGQMGLAFEDNGVNVKLANPYYAGTPFQQAASIARDAGIEWIIDRGTLAISPPGKSRQGDAVLISPQTGLVGYPMFNEAVVICQALFNPAFKMGGQVEIRSDLTAANGKWITNQLVHYLDAEVPKGKWFSLVSCYGMGETVG